MGKCDFNRCFNCTYVPSSRPSFTLLSSSPSSSSSYTPTYRNITLFPTKASSSSYVPTLAPTTVSSCEKDNGKKFDYLGDKYSCKQLNKSKKKYRKRMCMRVKQARNLCPVICKYKI